MTIGELKKLVSELPDESEIKFRTREGVAWIDDVGTYRGTLEVLVGHTEN